MRNDPTVDVTRCVSGDTRIEPSGATASPVMIVNGSDTFLRNRPSGEYTQMKRLAGTVAYTLSSAPTDSSEPDADDTSRRSSIGPASPNDIWNRPSGPSRRILPLPAS